ncbi:TetR family transcriptional regulator [Candidatus Izimaplasma bacterium ZiA1]|uniref:TetR/AcrR family transcriptional regulator n=1 Tax=Candidatus Izimoplasma sp. ZiA1 TaxID=2024899 RepID=UPI000BAA8798|nr:TetR family transcriptional regulator [Candidatus Izimaplasma bacterium ZiA1]
MKSTEEKILKAATKMFSEYGYNGVSTKKIATAAGVNEVTIFRHYTNKSNLLQAVIKHYSFEGNIIEKVKSDLTGDVERDLEIFAEDYYMFLVNNIKMYKIQMREITDEAKRFTNSVEYVEFMRDYLQKKVDINEFTGDPSIISKGIISMIMGIFTFNTYAPDVFDGVPNRRLICEYVDKIVKLYVVKKRTLKC